MLSTIKINQKEKLGLMNNNTLSIVIKSKGLLPNRVFNDNIISIKAFEPSFIIEDFFFEALFFYLNKSKQKKIIVGELIGDTLFDLDLGLINYNYWVDKIFSIDGLYYIKVGVTSESANWALYIDNVDFEIGLVGFCNLESERLFLESFGKNVDIFTSPKDFIENMDSVLNFSNKAKEIFNNVVKNNSSD